MSRFRAEPAPPGSRPGLAARRRALTRLPGPDSVAWIALAAAAFTVSQLVSVPPRLGLSWDEVVYVSQVSPHAPAAFFDPARSRGIPLLVAPLELVTSSVVALRAYLAVASGLALFGSLLAWRRLRPAWQLALAGAMFGSLWVARFYGPQAMPDLWMAFAALAATGLFLRAAGAVRPADDPAGPGARARGPAGWPLAGLALAVAAGALVRIGDAVFLAALLVLAALAVPAWRKVPLVAAVVAGLAAGAAEWVVEAFLRFGGPLRRLRLAGAEQGGLGLHAGFWAELRALNGPTLCRPCTVGVRYPVLDLWWLALPVLVVLGMLAARRAGRLASSALAAACALALAGQYLIGVDYAAPRFLLPYYALASVPVADLVAGVLARTSPGWRSEVTVLIGVILVAQAVVQQAVLSHEVAGTARFHAEYARVAADLRRLGIAPPCLLNGAQRIPVAFYAGCASTPDSAGARPPAARSPFRVARGRFAVLEWPHERPPAFARGWRRVSLPGAVPRRLVAYLPA